MEGVGFEGEGSEQVRFPVGVAFEGEGNKQARFPVNLGGWVWRRGKQASEVSSGEFRGLG